jgi:hypothetical protein
MTGVCEHWGIIPHLNITPVDQLLQMIWVDGQQGPLRFDVSKRPNEVNGPQGAHPRYLGASAVFERDGRLLRSVKS